MPANPLIDGPDHLAGSVFFSTVNNIWIKLFFFELHIFSICIGNTGIKCTGNIKRIYNYSIYDRYRMFKKGIFQ